MQIYSLNGKHIRYGREIIVAYLLDKPTLPKFTVSEQYKQFTYTLDTQDEGIVKLTILNNETNEPVGELDLLSEDYNIPRYCGLDILQDKLINLTGDEEHSAFRIYELLIRECINTWLTSEHDAMDTFFLSIYRRLDSSMHLYFDMPDGNQIWYDYIPTSCDNAIDYPPYLLKYTEDEGEVALVSVVDSIVRYAITLTKVIEGDSTYRMMRYVRELYHRLVVDMKFKWVPYTMSVEPSERHFGLVKGITLMYAYLPYLNQRMSEHEDYLELFNGYSRRWLMLYYYFCDRDVFNMKANDKIKDFFFRLEKVVLKDDFIQWFKLHVNNTVTCSLSLLTHFSVYLTRPTDVSIVPGTLPGGIGIFIEDRRILETGVNVSPEFVLGLFNVDLYHTPILSEKEKKQIIDLFTVPSSEWPLVHVLRNLYTKYIQPTETMTGSQMVH